MPASQNMAFEKYLMDKWIKNVQIWYSATKPRKIIPAQPKGLQNIIKIVDYAHKGVSFCKSAICIISFALLFKNDFVR